MAEVLRRAGVSRETFYEQFANKEECFLAAYDAGATTLLQAMGTELDSEAPAKNAGDRLDRALKRYLGRWRASRRWRGRSWSRSMPLARRRSRGAWRCSGASPRRSPSS